MIFLTYFEIAQANQFRKIGRLQRFESFTENPDIGIGEEGLIRDSYSSVNQLTSYLICNPLFWWSVPLSDFPIYFTSKKSCFWSSIFFKTGRSKYTFSFVPFLNSLNLMKKNEKWKLHF